MRCGMIAFYRFSKVAMTTSMIIWRGVREQLKIVFSLVFLRTKTGETTPNFRETRLESGLRDGQKLRQNMLFVRNTIVFTIMEHDKTTSKE